jgi:multidrug efflux system membrane fusion protein
MRRLLILVIALALVGGGSWWWSRSELSERAQAAVAAQRPDGAGPPGAGGGARAADGGARATPVRTAVVEQQDVPIEISGIGRVAPLAIVTVRSRIDSQIMGIHFEEGQEVKQGDPLFTLDDRPASATLRQAEANLAKDQAQLKLAQADVQRYADLVQRNVASKQQNETAIAAAASLEASIAADQAMVDQAKLTLSFTQIASPIDGRTGAVLVDPGNLVKGNDNSGTGLVTITQLRPIGVTFTLPERNLGAIRDAEAAMKKPLGVQVQIGKGGPVTTGELSFIDSSVDTTTGTIALKGIFPNADTKLWPGQFVTVTLELGDQPDALVVPSEAVQAGQDGPFVFLVKPDQTVEVRSVTVERAFGSNTVVAAGLAAGDRVVVDGQLRLVPGARVAERDGGDRGGGAGQDGSRRPAADKPGAAS